jgi:hypothetical protein
MNKLLLDTAGMSWSRLRTGRSSAMITHLLMYVLTQQCKDKLQNKE